MADSYFQRGPLSPDAPAYGGVATTGADQDTSKFRVRGVYIGTGGSLKVDMADGSTGLTFANMVAGQIYPLQITKVYASPASTATGILLL